MSRTGTTWRNYQQLVHSLSGGSLRPVATATPEEQQLLHSFRAALRRHEPEAQALLAELNISTKQYLFHLHYIAHWNAQRRRLLEEGGIFQLLEGKGKVENQLSGLSFTGLKTRLEQHIALETHLQQQTPEQSSTTPGWLPPLQPIGSRLPRRYQKNQLVWIYDQRELAEPQDLHPAVARSLVAEYMKSPGQVVDPMSGSGTLVREARLQGHTVWSSDKRPRDAQTVEFDLWENELLEELEHTVKLDVGLLVLHPPVPETLGNTLQKLNCTYDAWLMQVLEHSWDVLASGGHLALIITIATTADTVSQAEFALLESYRQAFHQRGRLPRPTATRLAVSRDGRQGWHILVVQTE